MIGLNNGHLVLSIYDGLRKSYLKIKTSFIPLKPCYTTRGPSSPALWAMQHKKVPDLQLALKHASIHSEDKLNPNEKNKVFL